MPSAPVLSSPSSTSLSVSWFAPLNTGPSISDYDVWLWSEFGWVFY